MGDTRLGVATPHALMTMMKDFAAEHDGTSAVVEYVGKRGARIVLAASDGASADLLAPATDVAREACRQAGVDVVNTWERELFEDIEARAAT
jgi:fructose-specific phosphotransferase system component IIB